LPPALEQAGALHARERLVKRAVGGEPSRVVVLADPFGHREAVQLAGAGLQLLERDLEDRHLQREKGARTSAHARDYRKISAKWQAPRTTHPGRRRVTSAGWCSASGALDPAAGR